jgi:hypothetical protein
MITRPAAPPYRSVNNRCGPARHRLYNGKVNAYGVRGGSLHSL